MLWQSSTSRDFSLNPVSLETHGMMKMVVLKKEKVLFLLGESPLFGGIVEKL